MLRLNCKTWTPARNRKNKLINIEVLYWQYRHPKRKKNFDIAHQTKQKNIFTVHLSCTLSAAHTHTHINQYV